MNTKTERPYRLYDKKYSYLSEETSKLEQTWVQLTKGSENEEILEKHEYVPEGTTFTSIILKAKNTKSLMRVKKYIKNKWTFGEYDLEIDEYTPINKDENSIVLRKKKNGWELEIYLESYYGQWITPHKAFLTLARNNPDMKVYIYRKKFENNSENTTDTYTRVNKNGGKHLLKIQTTIQEIYTGY